MVSIVHVKDDICPGVSHIINQFVRTKQCQPYSLQQLYVASSDEHGNTPESSSSIPQQQSSHLPSTSEEDENVEQTVANACIVCQVVPINRVVMPCRHACVCDRCFTKLDKCPMCRGYIMSYFRLDNSFEESDSETDNEGLENERQEHWFIRLNDRLNNWLGFT